MAAGAVANYFCSTECANEASVAVPATAPATAKKNKNKRNASKSPAREQTVDAPSSLKKAKKASEAAAAPVDSAATAGAAQPTSPSLKKQAKKAKKAKEAQQVDDAAAAAVPLKKPEVVAAQDWYPSHVVWTSDIHYLDVAKTRALKQDDKVIIVEVKEKEGESASAAAASSTPLQNVPSEIDLKGFVDIPPKEWKVDTRCISASLSLPLGTWNIGGRYSDSMFQNRPLTKSFIGCLSHVIQKTVAIVLQEVRMNTTLLFTEVQNQLNKDYNKNKVWRFVLSEPLTAGVKGAKGEGLRERSALFYRSDVFVLNCPTKEVAITPLQSGRGFARFDLELRDLELPGGTFPLHPPVTLALFACHLQSGSKVYLNKVDKAERTKQRKEYAAWRTKNVPKFGQPGFNSYSAHYHAKYIFTNAMREVEFEQLVRTAGVWYAENIAGFPAEDGPLKIPCLVGDFNQDIAFGTDANERAQLQLLNYSLYMNTALQAGTSTSTLTFCPSSLDNIVVISRDMKESCEFENPCVFTFKDNIFISDHTPVIATLRIKPGMCHSAEQ